jgi:hypothetical protein
MFLSLLKENNKELFLKVCVYASLANGVFADEEKAMIFAYCREMNIAERIPESDDGLESVLKDLVVSCDAVEKKIVVLEILGLIKSDGVYDEKEKLFMKQLADGLQINESVVDKLNSLLEIYVAVCKEIRTAVCE